MLDEVHCEVGQILLSLVADVHAAAAGWQSAPAVKT